MQRRVRGVSLRSVAALAVVLAALVVSTHAHASTTQTHAGKRHAAAHVYDTRAGPRPGMLNVHLVSHTHDDVGWLKTVDQYYMGANNSIQHAGVQYVLDSVVHSLSQNPDRRFIYVEIAFFQRWWDEQNADTQALVRQLVQRGQLEFINGGWCMSDEAATLYSSTIDQMTLGHQWLVDTFGTVTRPRIGWHIDPFGHSSGMASLLAGMAFDGFFFSRIDYQDKEKRTAEKSMEMMWLGSASLGSPSNIFTGVTYTGYGPPDGFCFDPFCDDPPIQDNPEFEDYNVEERVNLFVQRVQEQATHYQTNHIMLTMGSDFQYENANEWYKNLDKLIHYVNQDGRVNAFYSTPSIYLDNLNAEGATWPSKSDDFFPYADNPWAYWTGYFVSRPAGKAYERTSNGILQVCKQLEAAVPNDDPSLSSRTAQEAMGINQHHDGITGTEKQHVANDYAKRLSIGNDKCADLIHAQLASLIKLPTPAMLETCFLRNESICHVTQTNGGSAIVLYNALSTPRSELVRVPVNGKGARVVDTQSRSVGQLVATFPPAQSAEVAAPYEIVFVANVPAMGFATYFVQNATSDSSPAQRDVHRHHAATKPQRHGRPSALQPTVGGDIVLENDYIAVHFNASGAPMRFENKKAGIAVSFAQTWFWYNASADGDADSGQPSGAYIFRPNSTATFPVGAWRVVAQQGGSVVQQLTVAVSDWVQVTFALRADASWLDMEYTVGPIPFEDGLGREVVVRFETDIVSASTWYTDANGRDMQTRIRNFRPTWNLNVTEPVAGNYYPVNSAAYIRDSVGGRQLTVVTDRSQGCASLSDGTLEFMVHRRLLHDDHRGVGEPLNETGVLGTGLITRGNYRIVFDTSAYSGRAQRLQAQRVAVPLWFGAAPYTGSVASWVASYTTSGSLIGKALPPNVNLLTLQVDNTNLHVAEDVWSTDDDVDEYGDYVDASNASEMVLLRLDHLFAVGEDAEYSVPVHIDLASLFPWWSVQQVTELTLSGNQPLAGVHRRQWKLANGDVVPEAISSSLSGTVATLNPFEIRTYRVVFGRK